MKISIAQINPTVGDVPENLKKILTHLEQAKREKADWILFPELALVGYPPRDLLDFPRLGKENEEALEQIKKSSSGIGVIVGALRKNAFPSGKKFFNSAFVFRDQKLLFAYDKRLLPSYDVFEDERYFEKGTHSGVFDCDGKKYGVAICEDVWNQAEFLERPYEQDPLRDLEGKSLEALFILSASPFDLHKGDLRAKLLAQIARKLQAPIFYCNQVAGNDELLFDGASLIVNESGQLERLLPAFKETLEFWEPQANPLPQNERSEEKNLFEALSFGLRDYVLKSHQKKICLGLSGGIDSSVAAVLAVEAVGKENVMGVSLPSRFTSSASREDAKTLAARLGIEFQEFDLEPVFSSFEKVLAPLNPQGLTLENIQPRIRMTLLKAISNQKGMLLMNTSNKSEIATGYSTLYGDSAGALAPLGDLLKNQVRALAMWMNRGSEIVPHRVIERAPSAKLRPDQKDEDTLPPYSILDPLVQAFVEKQQDSKALDPQDYSPKWLDLFRKLYGQSEYKRRQMPPVLRVSEKAFGMGRRMPLACRNPSDK